MDTRNISDPTLGSREDCDTSTLHTDAVSRAGERSEQEWKRGAEPREDWASSYASPSLCDRTASLWESKVAGTPRQNWGRQVFFAPIAGLLWEVGIPSRLPHLVSPLHTHQLLGAHVVKNPFGVLTVVATLHDGQEQFGGIVLMREEKEEGEHEPGAPVDIPRAACPGSERPTDGGTEGWGSNHAWSLSIEAQPLNSATRGTMCLLGDTSL